MRDDCSIDEFALVMGVTPTTVRNWIKRGKMPSAFKNEMDCWRIPNDTQRPTKIYLQKPRRISLPVKMSAEIKSLRKELADHNERYMAHLEKYVGLLGRYDKLLLDWEIAKEDAEAYERKYDELKSQYDQLALTLNGLTLHEEGVCHIQEIVSSSTPKTGLFRQRRKRR